MEDMILTQERVAARFDSALYAVCPAISRVLTFLDPYVKGRVQEIRLRAGQPLALTAADGILYVGRDSRVSVTPQPDSVMVTNEQIEESYLLLTNHSVYSHLHEIREGYIAMCYGHRAGVCGHAVGDGNIRDISSVNIRIAREIPGTADRLAAAYGEGGVLIAGPPGSGKTTVLRDLIRQLSDGVKHKPRRICAVDTRGELSASYGGLCGNDLGRNTDILLGYDKPKGIEIALRTLNPDLVAFDEIGTTEELKGVAESLRCGVSVLCTAHIGSAEELMQRGVTRQLLQSGAVGMVALLDKDFSMQLVPAEAMAL